MSVRLRAKAESLSDSLSNISIRDLNFSIDEPEARGGTNLGPTPTDTAISALIGCTNVIAHKCADTLLIDIQTCLPSSLIPIDMHRMACGTPQLFGKFFFFLREFLSILFPR